MNYRNNLERGTCGNVASRCQVSFLSYNDGYRLRRDGKRCMIPWNQTQVYNGRTSNSNDRRNAYWHRGIGLLYEPFCPNSSSNLSEVFQAGIYNSRV